MHISNPNSALFLPPFAMDAAWMGAALDAVLKGRYFRIAGLPAPLSAEALEACTEAELEAFFAEYGLADYYPDTPRAYRVRMMAAQARLWRFLGTPDALAELCKYILADGECAVSVRDCLAFDESGQLVNPDLLHIFDLEIEPSALAITARDHDRIIDNALKFAPNTETLRAVYYAFGGTALQAVRIAQVDTCASELVDPVLCLPVPGIPVGGTLDATSQTTVYTSTAGGIATRSGFSFVDKSLDGSMPDDGGTVDRSGFSFVDKALDGSMPDDGGTVARSGFSFVDKQLEGSIGGYGVNEIDVDCNWGDAVTIPAGYTVQSVKTTRAFAKITSRNLSGSTLTIDVGGEGEYIDDISVSDFTIKASPCLQVFAYSSSGFSNGYYITCNANQTPSTIPVSVDALKLNSDGLFFRLQALYSSALPATNVYDALTSGIFTVSLRYYDAVTNLVDYAFKAIPDSWSFVNGTFSWTPASATYDRFWLYLNKKPETRIHCVSSGPTPEQGGTISPDPAPIIAYKQDGTTSPGMQDSGKYQIDAVDSNYYTEEDLEALGWYVKWRVYSIPSSSGGINIRDSYGTSGTTVLTYWNNADHPIVNPFLQGPSGYTDWWQMKFTLNGGSVQTGWSRFGIEGLGVTYEEKTVTTDVVNLYH